MRLVNPVKWESPIRLRLYGVVFLAVLALLLSLTVAVYQKAFVRVVPVQLQTDQVGNQLAPPADVKLRGVIVGEVRGVRADGKRATVDLALKPEYARAIPADVEARLLPKTLFGERYVELVPPVHAQPDSAGHRAGRAAVRPIRAGDVIGQDRSSTAIELERVFADLLPLLRTVSPGQLNATLSALADALEGRGDALGHNLERVESYLRRLNPHLDTLNADISLLADVASSYAEAAPDLLATARNLVTTSGTVVAKADTLAGFLAEVTGVAGTAEGVLAVNGNRIITLARVSRPTLALLARYAPEYPCLLAGLAASEPRLASVFSAGALHITLEVVQPQAGYRPGEEPRYADRSGPNCRGLPSPGVPAPAIKLGDGSAGRRAQPLLPGLPVSPGLLTPAGQLGPPGLPGLPGLGGLGGLTAPSSRVTGTAAEQRVVGLLLAPAYGRPADQVPPIATLLFGPMARGTAVSAE